MLGDDDAEKVDRIFDMLRSDEDERLTMGELNIWRKKLFRKQLTHKQYLLFCAAVAADPEEGVDREQFIALYARPELIDKVPLHFSIMVQDEFGSPNAGSGGDLDSLDGDDDDSV